MDIDELLKQLRAISDTLKMPSFQNQTSLNKDFRDNFVKFEKLVEEIELQQGNLSFEEDSLKLILSEILLLIDNMSKTTDTNLKKLLFLENIRPLS